MPQRGERFHEEYPEFLEPVFLDVDPDQLTPREAMYYRRYRRTIDGELYLPKTEAALKVVRNDPDDRTSYYAALYAVGYHEERDVDTSRSRYLPAVQTYDQYEERTSPILPEKLLSYL